MIFGFGRRRVVKVYREPGQSEAQRTVKAGDVRRNPYRK